MKKFSLLVLSLALPAFVGAADMPSSNSGSRSAAGAVPPYSDAQSTSGNASSTSGSVQSESIQTETSVTGAPVANDASLNGGVAVSTPAALSGGAGDTSGSVSGQATTVETTEKSTKKSMKRKQSKSNADGSAKSAEKKATDTTSQSIPTGTSSTSNPQ